MRVAQEFDDEGEGDAKRHAILEVLAARLGDVPSEVEQVIEMLQDEAALTRAFLLSVNANSYEDFLERLSES